MIFWATLGFGLCMLVVVFFLPRLAFSMTLIVLLDKSGWLQFLDKKQPDMSEFASTIITILFIVAASIGSIILDIYDHKNRVQ